MPDLRKYCLYVLLLCSFKNPLINSVVNEYRKSYTNEEKSQLVDVTKVKQSNEVFNSFSETTLLELIFKIIDSSKYSNLITQNNVIGSKEYEDLNFFAGSPAKPKDTFFSKIDRTRTLSGKAVLSLILANPTNDIEVLQQREDTIKFLMQNKDVYYQINELLGFFKKVESSVISLYSYGDFIYSQLFYDKLYKDFYTSKHNSHAAKLEFHKRIKKNLLTVEIPLIYPFFSPIFYSIGQPPIWSVDQFKQYTWLSSIPILGLVYKCFFFNSDEFYKHTHTGSNVNNFFSYSERIFEELFYINNAINAVNNLNRYNAQIDVVYQRMNSVKKFVQIIKSLEYLMKDVEIQSLKDDTQGINSFFKKCKDNLKLSKMLTKLLKIPNHSMSFVFNNTGNLLACFDLFGDVLHEFDEVIYEIGLLDAYMSMVDLLVSTQNKKNHLCFSDFLKKDTPFINVRALWNPFIDPDVVVHNDVNLDCEKEKTIIITGPNAGGKSSFVKGILYNAILSQTLGIAAAKRISLTPFKRISAYLNSVDKISSNDGKSLFVSNVLDTRDFLNSLDNKNFSLCVFDDIFSGTNPKISEALEFSTIEMLSDRFNNNLTIVSTHRSLVTTLEKKKNVKNYHVYITKDENDKIIYNYKIIRGTSMQRISIDLLRQNGYRNEIIYKASKMASNFSENNL